MEKNHDFSPLTVLLNIFGLVCRMVLFFLVSYTTRSNAPSKYVDHSCAAHKKPADFVRLKKKLPNVVWFEFFLCRKLQGQTHLLNSWIIHVRCTENFLEAFEKNPSPQKELKMSIPNHSTP